MGVLVGAEGIAFCPAVEGKIPYKEFSFQAGRFNMDLKVVQLLILGLAKQVL